VGVVVVLRCREVGVVVVLRCREVGVVVVLRYPSRRSQLERTIDVDIPPLVLQSFRTSSLYQLARKMGARVRGLREGMFIGHALEDFIGHALEDFIGHALEDFIGHALEDFIGHALEDFIVQKVGLARISLG
jgi:hypothetical protein